MKLKDEMRDLARKAGGAFKTVADREKIAIRVADTFKKDLNIQIKNVDQIKASHVEKYFESRLAEGINKRTLQNEMSCIRQVLIQAGRTQLVELERLDNKALGIGGASRKGTNRPIPDDVYREMHSNELSRDEGMAAAMELSRAIGLRMEESVQADKSLKTWAKHLGKGSETLRVIYGTKGDRPRDVRIIPNNWQRVIQAIETAISVAKKRGGHLIDKPNLQEAMDRAKNEMTAIGMTKEKSGYTDHSLRYAFAQEQYNFYREQGYSIKEARSLVSADLGHGCGRMDFIKEVYCQGLK